MATRKASASTSIDSIAVIAIALKRCKNKSEFNQIAAVNTEADLNAAYSMLSAEDRTRIRELCDAQPVQEILAPVTEQPAAYHVESQSESQPRRSLFSIGEDLERLNELLDDCGDDAQQQELISQWLDQTGAERDRKLDNYAALISEMTARAEVRKAEAKRMRKRNRLC